MARLKITAKVEGVEVPRFFYGTAWKKNSTESLVVQAAMAGFRAFDTANQRKHYYEKGVGNGISGFLKGSRFCREDFFLQSKFTYAFGQDHRLPFDPGSPVSQQVEDSFANSLAHLRTSYLDSYVLHGLKGLRSLAKEDVEAWAAMESLKERGLVHFLGVSNINAPALKRLLKQARIIPQFVQNRCFASTGWDSEVRALCAERGICYQGFSLLTANQRELSHPRFFELTRKYKKSLAQIVFRFCQQLGMFTLTGTSDVKHMSDDLKIYDFELTRKEVSSIENGYLQTFSREL